MNKMRDEPLHQTRHSVICPSHSGLLYYWCNIFHSLPDTFLAQLGIHVLCSYTLQAIGYKSTRIHKARQ